MITNETTINIGDFKVKFQTINNDTHVVTIENNELEFGASGMYSKNWNDALASAFENVAEIMFVKDAYDLLDKIKESEWIDNAFVQHLHSPWRELTEAEIDSIEAVWESTWIDGPQW